MLNALTIDVEDYFHVTAFEGSIKRADWEKCPLRVEKNTHAVLDLLDEQAAKGTFFVLGWVAERCPAIVKEIQSRGHELACHGYGHERIYQIGPDNFRNDLRRAKDILETIGGTRVYGYRAPSFSITNKSDWALDIILEEGFRYDSSIFPIYHDLYGMRGTSEYPYDIKRPAGVLKEFPLSTIEFRLFGKGYKVPVAGGGYLRLFPLWFMKTAIQRINSRDRQPTVLYFHPWEVDPDQPRIRAGLKSSFRHYHNLHKTKDRIRSLLSAFSYAPMGQVLGIGGCCLPQ